MVFPIMNYLRNYAYGTTLYLMTNKVRFICYKYLNYNVLNYWLLYNIINSNILIIVVYEFIKYEKYLLLCLEDLIQDQYFYKYILK